MVPEDKPNRRYNSDWGYLDGEEHTIKKEYLPQTRSNAQLGLEYQRKYFS